MKYFRRQKIFQKINKYFLGNHFYFSNVFHFFKNLLFFLEIMSDQIYIFHLDGGDELVALASKTIYGKAGLQT